MGEVYRARDTRLRRDVAIKVQSQFLSILNWKSGLIAKLAPLRHSITSILHTVLHFPVSGERENDA